MTEQNVCDGLEFLSEIIFVTGNNAVENGIPVVVHESVHCVAQNSVAVKEIVEPKFDPFRLELDFVASDVNICVVVVSLIVFAMQFMSCSQLVHGNIGEAGTSDGEHKNLSVHGVLPNKV